MRCVFRPKWRERFGRSDGAISEQVNGVFRGCGTAIPAHVTRPRCEERKRGWITDP